MNDQIDGNLKEILENDEEMANAIIDTENDVDDDTELVESNNNKSDSWKGDKIKERRKQLKRLEKQYENCLQTDKYSNDEERVKFEESQKRMIKAIQILKIKESENFIRDYIRDLKRVFSRKIKEDL